MGPNTPALGWFPEFWARFAPLFRLTWLRKDCAQGFSPHFY